MAIMTPTVEQCVYSRNMSIAFWLFGKCCNGIYYFLCFVDCTSLYNLVNKANSLHNYS